MKSLVIGLVGVQMLFAALPASAQYYQANASQYANQNNSNLSARIDQLRLRLQAGVQNGSISRQEAAPIRDQIRQLNRLERQYEVNGLSGQERADLQQRIRSVRQQLRVADNGANGRYSQWEAEDGYSQGYQQGYGQGYQQPYQQGYDQGYQQPYPQGDGQGYNQPIQQGGLAGVIGRVLGGGGLQVGQRVSGNLYGVPPQHQGHYRDGNGVYYRSDGRRIYQIDARSHTVVRVFPM